MKILIMIILALIALSWLIAIPQTLRGKRKKLTYMSFWQAYWYRGWLNMVDWIVIILSL